MAGVAPGLIGSKRPPGRPSTGFSDESGAHAASFEPRPSDVFITTPPKTGTTWLQHALHCLRAACAEGGAPGWQERAMGYNDLYEVAPWDQMAWDYGQDLSDEQRHSPRLFKTHLPLSMLNPKAKFVCAVRDPEKTLVSWYSFLKGKDVPPLRKYWAPGGGGVSAFARDPGFFAENMRFGISLWGMYREFLNCAALPNVLVVSYEDMVADFPGQLRMLARFLELEPSDEVVAEVTAMSSKAFMAKPEHASKFDESWTYKKLLEIGRVRDASSFAVPTSRVNVAPHKDVPDDGARAFLSERWTAEITDAGGPPSYAAFCDLLRAEQQRKLAAHY